MTLMSRTHSYSSAATQNLVRIVLGYTVTECKLLFGHEIPRPNSHDKLATTSQEAEVWVIIHIFYTCCALKLAVLIFRIIRSLSCMLMHCRALLY